MADKSCDQAMPSARGVAWSLSEAAAYFLIGVILDVVVGLRSLGEVLAGSLLNPDSYMRLVRLRDILGQHLPLHVVARDASGDGTVLAWSHLLDAMLLVLAAPLRLTMSGPQALHWSGVALGPVSAGLLAAAVAWVLAPLTSRGWRWTAPVLAVTSPSIAAYAVPGVVHHHVLIAFTIAMTTGYAIRAGSGGERAGWPMGFWAAAGLWLTPETMPFTLAAYGGVGLAWLLHQDQPTHGRALFAGGCSFLLLVSAAVAIDPPYGGYGNAEIDRISIVYVMLAIALFAIGWFVWQLDRWRLPAGRRAAIGGAVAIVGLGIWLASFPAVARGPDGLLDPEQAKAFFGVFAEMQPVTSFKDGWAGLLDGALTMALLAVIAARARSLLWSYAAVACGLTLLLGCTHVRFLTYPAVLAAATLPLALTCCEGWPARWQSASRIAVIALLFAGPYSMDIPELLSPAAAATDLAPSCAVRMLGPLLAPYAGEVVMANANDSPELLYRTDIRTVGSNYLPDVASFMRLRAAWRSAPGEQVPEAVQATRATLLLFCPSRGRPGIVADLPENTLWDRLNRGEAPPWLERVGDDAVSGHVLYRISKPRDTIVPPG